VHYYEQLVANIVSPICLYCQPTITKIIKLLLGSYFLHIEGVSNGFQITSSREMLLAAEKREELDSACTLASLTRSPKKFPLSLSSDYLHTYPLHFSIFYCFQFLNRLAF
jgi:hypothetical protein